MRCSRWCLGFAMLAMMLIPAWVPALAGVAHAGPAAAPVILEGARLIDGTGKPPRDNAALVIEGDKITAVGVTGKLARPKGARVVDLHGRTIMPGLISAHSHAGLVIGAANSADAYTREAVQAAARQYEQYGVTSFVTLGLNRDLVYELRDQQRQGTVPGASIFTAGRGIGAPGSVPPQPVQPDQVYRAATADEARAQVREMAGHHVDIVKLWVDDNFGKFPKMQPEVYRAVIDECHKQKLRVAAHVFYLADAKALIAAGVDVLAHSVRDQPVDAELIRSLKAHGAFYIPTLNVDHSFFVFVDQPEVLSDPFFQRATSPEQLQMLQSQAYKDKVAANPVVPKEKAAFATATKNLKALHDAGVQIAFGTDSGANPERITGWAEHHELELMVAAGLSPMDAIVAATRTSAALIKASDRGTLEPGKRADFVVLAADPTADIRNTRQLVMVWHGGKEIEPRVPAASKPAR
ncbi:MAG TPA: amidohydrolase family protein [Kofleriaceae bacterium]